MTQNASSPKVAYILLWFPLLSETFIFHEIKRLLNLNLPIVVYTLYGKKTDHCTNDMLNLQVKIHRLGVKNLFKILHSFIAYAISNPLNTWKLLREGCIRKMRNYEALGENLWAFFASFYLSKLLKQDNINIIHAPWANGPATSAWIASKLINIPFAFTGRAGDIYPQDGLLKEKIRDAVFVRTNNKTNIDWLKKFCSPQNYHKIHLIYNTLTLPIDQNCHPNFTPPYKILAIGRLVRTKGFPDLFTAIARLKRENFHIQLTLIGDGNWKNKLLNLRKKLHLENNINMVGFVQHSQLTKYLHEHDLVVVPSVVHENGDRDGIPNVIMESLSHNIPVIATDVCGINEIIHDKKTGLLVKERDPKALANAIRYMLENKELALKMAQEGKELITDLFDQNKNTKALYDLYCSVCTELK